MDRITEHHVRVIRIAIIVFGAITIVGYSYLVGEQLHDMRETNKTSRVAEMFQLQVEDQQPDLLGKSHHKHKPYELLSFIATCMILNTFIHLGLLIGTVKRCKCLLKLWIVDAFILSFLGLYLAILTTFGTHKPQYGQGFGYLFATFVNLLFIFFVWVLHERGDELETVIRTHPLRNEEDPDDLIPGFNN